jgi:hypothetical protein
MAAHKQEARGGNAAAAADGKSGSAGAFDRDADAVGLTPDLVHVAVHLSKPDDAWPVTDVAVVEDQVAGGLVVADVADLRSSPGGVSSMVNGCGSLATFSTPLKSRKLKVIGSRAARSRAVGLSDSRPVITVSQWMILTGVSPAAAGGVVIGVAVGAVDGRAEVSESLGVWALSGWSRSRRRGRWSRPRP